MEQKIKQNSENSFESFKSQDKKTSDSKNLSNNENKNIGMAVVAYILFFVPLLTDAKDDPFVKYHVHQGFVLFLAAIIANLLSWTFFILMIAGVLMQIGIIILAIIGIMNALHGKEEPLPIIGQFADKVTF